MPERQPGAEVRPGWRREWSQGQVVTGSTDARWWPKGASKNVNPGNCSKLNPGVWEYRVTKLYLFPPREAREPIEAGH